MKYRLNMVNTTEGRSVMVLTDETGESRMVSDGHPNYLRIFEAVNDGNDPGDLLDPQHLPEPVAPEIHTISDRVSLVDGVLHFDGEPIDWGLTDTILRYRREDRDPSNIVKFMERLSTNPSENSRKQLFTWTQAKDLTIDVDGFIIAYKGVAARTDDQDFKGVNGYPLFSLDKYPFRSCSSGHGVVDGIDVNGHLPMGVGVTVEMPRGEVADDPGRACASGLHVGTFAYAKGYARAGALLEIRIDPADVVSVPRDSGGAKMRCCRYVGVAIHDLAVGDDLSDYEPEPAEDAAWDAFATTDVPKGILASLKERIRRNRKVRKGGDEEEV